MTQFSPFISFWENLQLNVVLENRNLARLYHRSLEGCQASHLKSTFQMIIRPWVPELGQYTENSNNKIHTLNTYLGLAMLRNKHRKFSKFCPYFLPKICFSRATWKMKIMRPPQYINESHKHCSYEHLKKPQKKEKIDAFISWVGLE